MVAASPAPSNARVGNAELIITVLPIQLNILAFSKFLPEFFAYVPVYE